MLGDKMQIHIRATEHTDTLCGLGYHYVTDMMTGHEAPTIAQLQRGPLDEASEYFCNECVEHEDYPLLLLAAYN